MKIKISLFFLGFFLLFTPLVIPSPVKAAPSYATIQYVENYVNKKISQLEKNFNQALQQINKTLLKLTIKTDILEQRVASLETRVYQLENPPTPSVLPTITPVPTSIPTSIPTPPPLSGTFTVEVPIEVTGYTRMTVSINGQQDAAAIWYSDDQTNWKLQSKFGGDFGSKSEYIYPVKGKYYMVGNWGSPRTFSYTLDNVAVTGPTVDFTYSPQNPVVNQTMTFTDTSSGGTQMKWEFGSPYTFYSSSPIVNLKVTQTGVFAVLLYVQNAQGISEIKEIRVTVGN